MRNDLIRTDYESMIIRVIQESAEVIHAITKFQQYGPIAIDDKTGIIYNNSTQLLSELDDVEHAMLVLLKYLTIHTNTSNIEAPSYPTVQSANGQITLYLHSILVAATNTIWTCINTQALIELVNTNYNTSVLIQLRNSMLDFINKIQYTRLYFKENQDLSYQERTNINAN